MREYDCRDIPSCAGLSYSPDSCHCHMDQCLEAARFTHILSYRHIVILNIAILSYCHTVIFNIYCHIIIWNHISDVRFTHIKACGHTSLPQPEEVPDVVDEVVSDGNGTELAGNVTKEFTEDELMAIYAEMFNFVTRALS